MGLNVRIPAEKPRGPRLLRRRLAGSDFRRATHDAVALHRRRFEFRNTHDPSQTPPPSPDADDAPSDG